MTQTTTSTVTPPTTGTPTPAVAPAATIRTMIVCVPDGLPTEVLASTRQLDRHLGVQGTVSPRFWAKPLYLWQRRQMFDLRKGRPTYCAGGPTRLLDLVGMRHAAGVGAGIRYQLWARVVHGTRPATPWPAFVQRHLADQAKYPLAKAEADFAAQPRVLAMAMHNAAAYGAGRVDVYELEMLQAGPVAYQHYHALTAVAGDAVLDTEGAKLQPASDAMADRVTYLDQATRYLDSLEESQRILAVAL